MAGAREAALTALEKCRRSGAWSDAVLGSVMDAAALSRRDRALATALCYGVMQNRFYLDYYIDRYYNGKLVRLEPKILDILRISAYQILFMDRIPAHSAVHEAVEITRSLGYSRAAGLINALLRRISEQAGQLPPIEGKTEEILSVRYSCPVWLLRLFAEQLGLEETEALLRAQNETPPVNIQRNPLKANEDALLRELKEEGVEAVPHPWLPDCYECHNAGALALLSAFQTGQFYVQDAAAKMAVLAAGPKAGDRILDVCGAPGGKSFAAAALTGDDAEITTCDLHENKCKRIREGAERLGLRSIRAMPADGRVFRPEWESQFDLVIADVPCSGLGVIRKKPDIRYKDPAAFIGLEQIQRAILSNVSRYVKPGGTLLYSTCTLRREENATVAEAFLQEQSAFVTEEFSLPGEHVSQGGMLQLWPQRDGTDGFFIAKFRRIG